MGGGAHPTGVLITVVCRGGRLVDTACEFGWHLGWRYSNHGTDSFWGATFVVTTHGWLDVDQPHRFGVQPRLADPALRQLRVVP